MNDGETQLNRLPQDNVKEAERLVKSLKLRLKEICQEAERIRLEDIRKTLRDQNE